MINPNINYYYNSLLPPPSNTREAVTSAQGTPANFNYKII